MKRCPACGRTFTNSTLTDCRHDGTPLVEDTPAPPTHPEIASRDYSEDIPLADFEETAALAGSGTPRFGRSPLAVSKAAMHGTPPPYFAAQARRNEAKWPGIVLLCFLAVFVIGGGLMLRHDLQKADSKENIPPAAVPITATDPIPDTMQDLFPGLKLDNTLTQTPDSALRSSLIAAVKNADAAEARSFSTLDPAPLRSFYAGPALAVELGEMQDLKKAGATQKGRLTAQRFKSFQVNPEYNKAEVDLAETWNTTTRSKASSIIHRYPSEESS